MFNISLEGCVELLAGIMGLFGAILGGIAGAFYSNHLKRARPSISLDKVAVTNDGIPGNAIATVNRSLVQQLNIADFTQSTFSGPGKTRETDYIKFLLRCKESLEGGLEIDLPAIISVTEQLRSELASDNFLEFEKIWSVFQTDLWPRIEGAYIQGRLAMVGPVPDYNSLPNVHDIIVDDDGDLYIGLVGALNIGFIVRRNHPQSQKSKAIATRMANAFKYRIKADLQHVVNFLRDDAQKSESATENLLADLNRELAEYQRFNIEGQVGNSGSAPLSVLNHGALFVRLAGFPYRSDEDGRERRLAGDLALEVVVGNEEGNFGSPITVPQGGVARFVATSRLKISEVDNWAVVRSAFNGGERRCYAGLVTVLPGAEGTSVLYSDETLFRDLSAASQVLPKGKK